MKKIFALILALVMALSLCACGAKSSAYDAKPAEAPAAAYSYSAAAGDFAMAEEAAEMDYAIPEPTEAYGGLSADNGAAAAGGNSNPAATINPEKIIYSASASLETTEFDETLQKLNDMISAYGGFLESSSVSGANYYNQSHGYTYNRSASYTIRVPSAKFSELMTALPTLGNVPYSNTYTDNITSQYYDLQARLTAYQAQEARLIEMMAIAETVEDIITIEDRLTEVRYQIDSFQSRLNNWDRQVNYSTVYLDITEVQEYTPTETVKTTYGQRLVRAMKNGFKSVGDFFADFLLWLLEALPTLVLLTVVIILAVKLVRKTRSAERQAKRAEKKAAKQAKKAARKAKAAPLSDVQAWPLDAIVEEEDSQSEK